MVGINYEIYAMNSAGKELYPKNDKGKEIYAKNYLDEYYATDENLNQYYAMNERGKYYFAKNEFGDEIYARNSKEDEFYFSNQLAKTRRNEFRYARSKEGNIILPENKIQIAKSLEVRFYPKLNGDEIYEKENGIDKVVYDEDDLPHYAKNKDNFEIYPKGYNGKPFFTKSNTREYYAKDDRGNEYYFKGVDANVLALEFKNDAVLFAKTNSGVQHYPTDSFDSEFTSNIYTLNGYVVYPKDVNDNPRYPTDEYGNQYYIYDTRRRDFAFGTDNLNKSSYAQDNEGNEIYPPNFSVIFVNKEIQFALDKDGFIKYPKDEQNNETYFDVSYESLSLKSLKTYAHDNMGYVIYPTDSLNNERYLLRDDTYSLLENEKVRDYANNIYPEKNNIEMVLNKKYIINIGYPRDEYNNEYTPN
ncbi:uncharacterized protein NPIL_138361, partial [Nephila pilipes]